MICKAGSLVCLPHAQARNLPSFCQRVVIVVWLDMRKETAVCLLLPSWLPGGSFQADLIRGRIIRVRHRPHLRRRSTHVPILSSSSSSRSSAICHCDSIGFLHPYSVSEIICVMITPSNATRFPIIAPRGISITFAKACNGQINPPQRY